MYCITKRCADYDIVLPSIQCEWSLYRDAAAATDDHRSQGWKRNRNREPRQRKKSGRKTGRRLLATSVPDQGDRS